MNIRKETLYSALPLGVITIINLVSVPLFLSYLGDQKYALWFYVLTMTGAFGFADMGMGVATGRFVGLAMGRNDPEAARQYWATGHWMGALLVSLMALAFVMIGTFWGVRWFNVRPEDQALLSACFIAGGGQLFASYYSQIWLILAQAQLDFGFIAAVRISGVVLAISGSLLLARWTRNPFILILWTALMTGIQVVFFVHRAVRRYGFGLKIKDFRLKYLKEMTPFSLKTFLNLLINSPSYGMDRIILGRLAPAAAFTNFTVAANIGQRVHGLGISIMGPVFHHTNRSGGRTDSPLAADIFSEGFRLIWICGLAGLLWMTVWRDLFLQLWLGPVRGEQVALVFIPVLWGWTLRAISSVSAAQLGSFDQLGTTFGFVVLNIGTTLAGVYGGWKMAGLPGAAWGFALAQILWVAQDLWVAKLVGKGGWLDWVNLKRGLMQLVVAAAFWGIARQAWAQPHCLQWSFAGVQALLAGSLLLFQLRPRHP